MFSFLKKKDKNTDILKNFDGRTVKYITKRNVDGAGNVNHDVVSKNGRIVVIDKEIRIIDGEHDLFRCSTDAARYFMLLSGDGITVEGQNKVGGGEDSFTVYFSYYRK